MGEVQKVFWLYSPEMKIDARGLALVGGRVRVRRVLSRLTEPAIHGGLGSARGAPGRPWPRAAHTTRESTLRTRTRHSGVVAPVT